MTFVVLLILAVIWAAVLIPPVLRARAEGRPGDSIGNFRHQLGVLQRTGPHATAASHGFYAPRERRVPTWTPPAFVSPVEAKRRRTQARRKDILGGLAAAMGVTLVLGFIPALRVFWALHLAFDVLFVAYVVALVYMKNLAQERATKIRVLPTAVPTPVEPALLLRRSAN